MLVLPQLRGQNMAKKPIKTEKPKKVAAKKAVAPKPSKPAAKPVAKAAKPVSKPAAKAPAKPASKPKEDQSVARLKALYKKWHDTRGGNWQEFIAMLGPDATWGSIANGTTGIEFAAEMLVGERISQYFELFQRDWEVVFCRLERVIAEGNSVVVVTEASWRHRRTDKSLMTPKVDIWDFENGKAVNFFEYFDTASAVRSAL